jgi:hypothetical protein
LAFANIPGFALTHILRKSIKVALTHHFARKFIVDLFTTHYMPARFGLGLFKMTPIDDFLISLNSTSNCIVLLISIHIFL